MLISTLSKYFKLNEDLCETLSLAHDLGHAPFGHAGEEALNDCMINHGGFDHNIQTIRIVTLLENKYYGIKGLNLSIETLDGLIKHNGPIFNQNKLNKILGVNFSKGKIDFLNNPSIEAQISSISDDIAYNSHDLEDGLKANLFNIEDLKKIPIISKIIIKHKKKINKNNKELFLREVIRDIINQMVKDIIINTKKNIKKNKINNIKDVYTCDTLIVCFSKKMNIFDTEIKKFLRKKMYFSPTVLKKTNEGKKIIKFLFKKISKNPTKFIKKISINKKNKMRNVCDFIAGMTDRYAINLYNKLK